MSDERKPMTDEELDAIQGRLNAITQTPWKNCNSTYYGMVKAGKKEVAVASYFNSIDEDSRVTREDQAANAEFIANAPTDIARLLAEVERLREEVKRRDKIVVELREEVASLQSDLDFSSTEQHILTRKLFDSRICHKAVLCEQKNPQEWKFEGEDGCERCWDEWAWHLATDAREEAERNAE